MTNLGRVYLFSNLITTHLFNGVGFGAVSWEHLFFFYWFQGRKISRVEDIKKREDQISRGKSFFFLFYQSKLLSHFVPDILVSLYTTLKERSLG